MNTKRAAKIVLGVLTVSSVILASWLVSFEVLCSILFFAIVYGASAAMIPLLAMLAEDGGILEDDRFAPIMRASTTRRCR